MGPKTHPASRIGASMTPERWRQVDAVVRGALALPPDARAAFITDACQRDVDLRREVEELLAVPTGDFLMRPAAAAFAEESDVAIRARVSAALADRYLVERELGRGATATVYLAQDVRHHRHVAVKVLHSELAAALGTERFLKEIELTANLQHPHVLPLFDSGEVEGFLYYVMPYVEGESLRERLERENQLPINEAVRHTFSIASALDYAHRQNVIHRDIKPENVMMYEGEAMVMDFGIAKTVLDTGEQSITLSGALFGTPAYVSPEQAAGAGQVDGRADQYSLAVVLYEMLAGTPPFVAPTARALIARHMTEPPPSVLVVRPDLPSDTQRLLEHMLAKTRAGRLSDAATLIHAIDDPQRLPPVGASPRRVVVRRIALAGAIAIILAGVIMLLALLRNQRG